MLGMPGYVADPGPDPLAVTRMIENVNRSMIITAPKMKLCQNSDANGVPKAIVILVKASVPPLHPSMRQTLYASRFISGSGCTSSQYKTTREQTVEKLTWTRAIQDDKIYPKTELRGD